MSDIIDAISERIKIFHTRTYKSLDVGAKTLGIIFISEYQVHGLLLHMLPMNFLHNSQYYAYNAKYRTTNRTESFTFKQDNSINVHVYCKYLKLIVVVCFCGNHHYHLPPCNQ